MSSLTAKPFQQGEVQTFTNLLCDWYEIRGSVTMAALIRFLRETAAAHPGCRLLATLDDFGQASYTSGHTTDTHDLDSTEGHDLSGLHPAAFEDGEHLGYLSTRSEFPIRRANFLRSMQDARFEDLAGKLHWGKDQWDQDFFTLNRRQDAIMDDEIYVQIVPVAHAWETMAAFPNGYFTSDLQPKENGALARHLEENYGYTLFGIGASYIGFLQGAPLTDFKRHAFAADILSIYAGGDDPGLRPRVARVLAEADIVLMSYSGN